MLGFTLEEARTKGYDAAGNGVDFSQLFGGLSFFLLLAGILLTVLLFLLILLELFVILALRRARMRRLAGAYETIEGPEDAGAAPRLARGRAGKKRPSGRGRPAERKQS